MLARLLQLEPLSVETCHWNVGVGVPLAATVKAASWPTATVWSAGWEVMLGATVAGLIVRVAALLVTVPALLLATQRYW